MTKIHKINAILLFAAVVMMLCVVTPCFAYDPETAPVQVSQPQELTGIAGWLGTYNDTFGMHNASIITTIFGAAFVAFFIAIVWGKLVEIYGALGGLIGGGAIVGTFWVFNHKLPGFGISPGGIAHSDGVGIYQFGMILQAHYATSPWVDMGLAVFFGLFTASFLERLRAKKLDPTLPGGVALLGESVPRLLSVILGGMTGGAVVGLIGFTGAMI